MKKQSKKEDEKGLGFLVQALYFTLTLNFNSFYFEIEWGEKTPSGGNGNYYRIESNTCESTN